MLALYERGVVIVVVFSFSIVTVFVSIMEVVAVWVVLTMVVYRAFSGDIVVVMVP
jgi:hypothetical protein